MRFADPLAWLLSPVCAAAVAWSFWPRRAEAAAAGLLAVEQLLGATRLLRLP
jgi:hypothetical protein